MEFKEIREFRERTDRFQKEMAELNEQLDKYADEKHMIRELMDDDSLAPELREHLSSQYENCCAAYYSIHEQRDTLVEECKDTLDELDKKRKEFEYTVCRSIEAKNRLLALHMETAEMDEVTDLASEQLLFIDEIKKLLENIISSDSDPHSPHKSYKL